MLMNRYLLSGLALVIAPALTTLQAEAPAPKPAPAVARVPVSVQPALVPARKPIANRVSAPAQAPVPAPVPPPAQPAAPPITVPAVEPAGRFASEIAAFARQPLPPADAVTALFIGSSSVRLWELPANVAMFHPVNRGFGGATVRDVLFHYPQLIAGVNPSAIIVYVGENDIAAGAAPGQVVADLLSLIERLHVDRPEARIAYLAMKASPARRHLYGQMEEVNRAMRAQAGAGFDYLDVGSVLLDQTGEPDPALFVDGLHLNASGYALWNGIVESWLRPTPAPAVEELTAAY